MTFTQEWVGKKEQLIEDMTATLGEDPEVQPWLDLLRSHRDGLAALVAVNRMGREHRQDAQDRRLRIARAEQVGLDEESADLLETVLMMDRLAAGG